MIFEKFTLNGILHFEYKILNVLGVKLVSIDTEKVFAWKLMDWEWKCDKILKLGKEIGRKRCYKF